MEGGEGSEQFQSLLPRPPLTSHRQHGSKRSAGNLPERVHGHLYVGQVHAAFIGLDGDLDGVVDDALDAHQDTLAGHGN